MTTTANDVLLYVPNLIGYSRVAFATASVVILLLTVDDHDDEKDRNHGMPPSPSPPLSGKNNSLFHWTCLAIGFYIAAFAGDLIDGYVARRLQQTSQFGGVLDMITDRCSTLAFLFVLSLEYYQNKPMRVAFCFLAVLDVSSHWLQMHSSLACLSGSHHKSDEGNRDKHLLVQWFYKYTAFFGYLCIGAEFTYVLLLSRIRLSRIAALDDETGASAIEVWLVPFFKLLCDYGLIISVPGCLLKQMVNIVQLSSSCYVIAQHDANSKNDASYLANDKEPATTKRATTTTRRKED